MGRPEPYLRNCVELDAGLALLDSCMTGSNEEFMECEGTLALKNERSFVELQA